MVAMGLWTIPLLPNTPFTGTLGEVVLLSNVALTDQLQDPEGRTSVRITMTSENRYESTFVLCSLTPGKAEQCTVNITLHSDTTYTFEAVGPNTVYLSGNYLDEFATIRHLRDILCPPVPEAHKAGRGVDRPAGHHALPTPSVARNFIGPQSGTDTNTARKRRRTSDGGLEAPTAESAPKQVVKGKEVERAVTQWFDYAPGQGEKTVVWGDEVLLKYKMVMAANAVLVSDNIQGKPLRLVVGDATARIPQAVHHALVGMKLKAQRIVKVPLEAARKDTSLTAFLKPAQAYRIDIFVVDIIPKTPLTVQE